MGYGIWYAAFVCGWILIRNKGRSELTNDGYLFMVHYRSSYLHRILLLLLLLLRKLHAWTSLLSSALGYISNLIHLFQARHVMSR